MKKIKLFSLLLFVLITLSSCELLVEDIQPRLSNLKMFSSFKILKVDNAQPTIKADITAKIDEATKTISLSVPKGTDPAILVPTYIVSPKSKVDLPNKTAQDFTLPVNYTITAENNSQIYYTVIVTVLTK